MEKCEKCNSTHDGTYGSGRFCSAKCARSFATQNMSEESNKRRLAGMKKANQVSADRSRGKPRDAGNPITNETKLKISASLKEYWFDNEDARENLRNIQTGRKVSEETKAKLSNNAKLAHKRKIMKPWAPRNTVPRSEIVWRKVLEENTIPFQEQYIVSHSQLGFDRGGYYAFDFLINGYIDLEIDGKHHKYPDRAKHDELRDKLVENAGYTVIRIEWVDPDKNPNMFYEQVKKLLKQIGNTPKR